MATLFRYEYHYVLYRMTFAQCLTMIQVRNEREKRSAEESEKRSKTSGVSNGFTDQAYDELSDISDLAVDWDDPDQIPHIDDVLKAFGDSSMLSK